MHFSFRKLHPGKSHLALASKKRGRNTDIIKMIEGNAGIEEFHLFRQKQITRRMIQQIISPHLDAN